MGNDLTGIWQGLYSYGGLGHHVGFTATLIEAAGHLHGTTHEVDLRLSSGHLDASLAGRRDGAAIRFTKVYASEREELAPVEYEGRVSPDGAEIEGTWAIPSFGSGRFLMTRPGPASSRAGRRAREPAGLTAAASGARQWGALPAGSEAAMVAASHPRGTPRGSQSRALEQICRLPP